jgi:hypothetical protein
MVVDIVVYSLILPSSVFGLVQEEVVPKLVMREKQKNVVPEQGGVVKEETRFLFTTRGERPLEPGLRTKPMGWVLQGAAMVKAAPQWIHRESIRTPRVPLLSWEQ